MHLPIMRGEVLYVPLMMPGTLIFACFRYLRRLFFTSLRLFSFPFFSFAFTGTSDFRPTVHLIVIV